MPRKGSIGLLAGLAILGTSVGLATGARADEIVVGTSSGSQVVTVPVAIGPNWAVADVCPYLHLPPAGAQVGDVTVCQQKEPFDADTILQDGSTSVSSGCQYTGVGPARCLTGVSAAGLYVYGDGSLLESKPIVPLGNSTAGARTNSS
jgi:hypothetical protein